MSITTNNRFLSSTVRTTSQESTLQTLVDDLNNGISITNATIDVTIDENNQTGTLAMTLPNLEYEKDTATPGVYDGIPILGTDGTNFRNLKTDTTGNLDVRVINGAQRVPVDVQRFGTTDVTIGTKTGSASIPVTIASDDNVSTTLTAEQESGVTLPISYTGVPVLASDGANFQTVSCDTLGVVDTRIANTNVPTNINQVNGASLSLGTTTASASLPVTVASDEARIRTTNGIVEYYPDLGTGFGTSGMNVGVVGTDSRQEFQCCSRLRVNTDGDIAYIYSDPLGIQNGVPIEFEGTFNQNHTDIETAIGLVDDVSETPSDGILIVQDGNLDLEIQQIQGGTIITTTAANFDVDIGPIKAQDWHDFKIVTYPTAAPVFKFYYRSSTRPDWYLFHTIYAREENSAFWFNSVKNMRVYARCIGITVLAVKWTDISVLNVYQGRDAGIPAPPTDMSKYETHFNQLMVAEETPMLQYTFSRNINPRLFGTTTSGDPTTSYQSTQGGSARCTINTAQTGQAGILSKETVNYRNGQMAVARFTAKITNQSNASASDFLIFGIGDRLDASIVPANGIFFQITDDGIGVRIHKDDTLIGAPSFFITDIAQCNGEPFQLDLESGIYYLFEIRFSYLGAYGCEWRIFNPDTDRWHTIHKYLSHSAQSFTYNSNMNWLQMVSTSTQAAGAVTIDTHSIYLGVVGKSVPNIEQRTILTRQTGLGDDTHFLGLRNTLTYASKTNFGRIYLRNIQVSIVNGGGNVSTITVHKNPLWAGAGSMANVFPLDGTSSIIEFSVSPGNPTGSEGYLLAAVNLANNGSDKIDFDRITLAPGEELLFTLRTNLSTAVNMSVLLEEDI